ncbi:hypothetical protein SLEP1_g41379 [Rubroshorea leprosula]|uniref:Ycf15 n=1 Tax=Rubroshorea leprosula TaxID=152421 RepID=A0AAV5L6U7_9ROSI|nr:hypothetical protein SLEP1_g41379 [Rubroshorea leprosula]
MHEYYLLMMRLLIEWPKQRIAHICKTGMKRRSTIMIHDHKLFFSMRTQYTTGL